MKCSNLKSAGGARLGFLLLLLVALSAALVVQRRSRVTRAEQLYDQGVAAASRHDLKTATARFQSSILADPHYAPSFELLAAAYIASHEPGSALDVLDRLRSFEPGRSHLYTRIAEAYAAIDRVYLLRWARQATIEEPRSPRARMMLALGLARSGDVRDAMAEYLSAEKLASSDGDRNSLTTGRMQARPTPAQAVQLIVSRASSVPY